MSERFAYCYLVLIILTAFFFGTYFLENMGIQYASEGGSTLFKIHIYSYITIGLFCYSALKKGIFQLISLSGDLSTSWWISFITISITIIHGLFRFGTSGLAYLINTVLVSILILPILFILSEEHRDKLLKLISWLIFINSIIAIFEFIFQSTLISVEFPGFSHFRSAALLTHPLNNALITASLAPLLISTTRLPAIIYFSVVFLALFAFGGRAAMAIFLLSSFILSLDKIKLFLGSGVKVNRYWAGILPFVFIIAVAFVVCSIAFTSLGDRILSKLFIDGSAEARFSAFILLEQLNLHEWLFGASHWVLDNISYFIEIKIIENYIIGWILNFGILGCITLIISSFLIPLKLSLSHDLTAKFSLISFLLISVSNNSLTTKTPALLFLWLGICLYCLKTDNQRIE